MATISPLRVRLLATNVLWNLAGQTAPLVVAVIAIPPLVNGLGIDRFGLLTLAWALIGYFSIFDLGLGRALTQLVASRHGQRSGAAAISGVAWLSLGLMLVLGVVVAGLLGLSSPWATEHFLKLPSSLIAEAKSTLVVISLAVPFVVTSTGLRGLLEARQRFAISNAIRVPLGLLTYAAPLAVLPFTHRTDALCVALLVSRIAAWIAYLAACLLTIPELKHRANVSRSDIRSLLTFSGWMALTNLVAPLMTYLDRFVISSAISVAAVAYYATPFEVVTRLLVIPAAVTGVMFPAFATFSSLDRVHLRTLYVRSSKYLGLTLFPIVLVFVCLAQPGLQLWLGSSFAERSTVVVQWLSVGVFLNALGQLAFVLVQGTGHPRITGLLSMVELPIYLLALGLLVITNGIEGAAIAWTLRTGLDALVLLIVAARLVSITGLQIARLVMPAVLAALMLLIGAQSMPLIVKIAFVAVSLFVFTVIAWFYILTRDERMLARRGILASRPA